MKRKRIILVLGMMYGMFGLSAAIACLTQNDLRTSKWEEEIKTEVVNVVYADVEETEMETNEEKSLVIEQQEELKVEETVVEEIPTEEILTEEFMTEETFSEEISSEEQDMNQTEAEEKEAYRAKVVNVGNSRLNIREEPSAQGKIIGYMYQDNIVEILKLGEEWHYVYFLGTRGYASAAYLQLLTEQEEMEIVR